MILNNYKHYLIFYYLIHLSKFLTCTPPLFKPVLLAPTNPFLAPADACLLTVDGLPICL